MDAPVAHTSSPLDLHIDVEGRRDLASEVYRQIRDSILGARLRDGERLPSTRELAERLKLSRTTVSVAYDRLIGEGYATTRQGSGTFVVGPAAPRITDRVTATPTLRPRALWDAVAGPPRYPTVPEFDFRPGIPDGRLFPYATWRRLLSPELSPDGASADGFDVPVAGHDGLRASVARYVALSRGVRATPEMVVITNGRQQSADLVARALIAPGDRVVVEEPGHPNVAQLFTSLGAQVCPVRVDGEGLVVDDLPHDARLVYVTPAHQFPTGVTMPRHRRLGLLEWADRHDAALIEDDYDGELRISGRPTETLHSLDASERVAHVGTFSLTLLPTLRLGFVVAPTSIVPALLKAKFVSDWQNPLGEQAALARFIDDGHLAGHVRRMRSVYRERHDLVVETLRRDFADQLILVESSVGLHLSALVRSGDAREAAEAIRRATAAGVGVVALAPFSVRSSTPPGVIFGYGAIDATRIPEGLRRFRDCWPG